MKRSSATRVARLDEQEILRDDKFRESLRGLAMKLQIPNEEAEKRAMDSLEELAVRPEDRYLDWVAKLARFMYSRSYDPVLDVNTEQLEHLRELGKEQPLVFLWSHKSHLDSFVFLRSMYDNDFRPQPLSFAGINMNFLGFGTLAKRSGAIFVRRSFSEDEIYKLVFRHYIDYLVSKRLPLSWSIEGTRSRTGKLMPPKLGLINWVIDAYRRSACNNALLVPVSISFDQIAEIDDYVSMQRGLPKRKESLKWFIDYISGMQHSSGRIYVRFAEPVSLSESVDISAAMFEDSAGAERIQTQKLAFEVCNRIELASPVKAADLVTLVLLAANDRALSCAEIQAHARQVTRLIEQRKLPTAGEFNPGSASSTDATLGVLTKTGLLQRYDQGGEAVFSIAPGKKLAAAYYRNTIIHYFLNSALAETALATLVNGVVENPEEAYQQQLQNLRDLLKFEFFFSATGRFRAEAGHYLESRFPDWQDALRRGKSPFETAPPLFGHSILRSFIEAYFVLSRTLKSHYAAAEQEPKALAKSCLALGEEMLLRKNIHCETALSQPLFENAARLAAYRGLLATNAEDLDSRRNQFALEMDHTLLAINRLQRDYDRYQLGITCAN